MNQRLPSPDAPASEGMGAMRLGGRLVDWVAWMVAGILPIGAAGVCHADPLGEARALRDQVGALEERGYAAWKSGDEAFWAAVLSRNFVTWGASGRIDRSAAIPMLSGASCRIASYRLGTPQLTLLGPDAALLTHRTEASGDCAGRPVVPAAFTATVYVREDGQWRMGYRAQSAIVDPLKASIPARSAVWTSGTTRDDTLTRNLLAREQAMVEAWTDHDGARMDGFFGAQVQFIDIFGNHIGSRAEALKAWSGKGCNVKHFAFSGAKAVQFVPGFAVLTYRAVYDGACFGQALWPIWATAFYARRDGVWMWSGGINVLAGAAGGGR